MQRVVIDTNILIASAYAPGSHSRRIVDACLRHELTLVASLATRREYEQIVARAVRKAAAQVELQEVIALAEMVHPDPNRQERVVPEDPDDDKFLAAAVAGAADAIVTNDQHVLAVGSYQGIPILRPSEFVQRSHLDSWRRPPECGPNS